jgi:hypothetical protein
LALHINFHVVFHALFQTPGKIVVLGILVRRPGEGLRSIQGV